MSDRKQELLDIGVALAAKVGVVNVTRSAIAEKAGISAPAVGKYLGTRDQQREVIKKAMRKAKVSEPDKKTIASIGQELRKKPRKADAPVVKPAKGRVTKVVKVPQKKVSEAKNTKPKRKPRPKPTVLPDVPSVTAP